MNLNQPGKASIIILTQDGLDYTRQCLESILLKTTYPDYEIVVVDNASKDGTLEYLNKIETEQKNFQIIRNQHNEGFSRGNNQGARAAKGEYLIFLNNDTVVTHGWLTRLIEHLQDPSIGIIGPVTNSASNEAKISIDYKSIEGLDRFAQEYTQAHYGESFEIRSLAFFCVAIKKDTFLKIGPLDERFRLGMFEDDDYALRVKQSGYKVICTEDVFIHHWGGGSFLKLDPYQYWMLFKENRKKFEDKWDITWQPHLQRTELLPDQVIKLSELVYDLQWQLLAESQTEKTDESFDIVIKRLVEQEHEIEQLNANLEEIKASNAWRIVQFIWKTRQTLFPQGSQREAFLSSVINKTRSPDERKHIIKPQPYQNKLIDTPKSDLTGKFQIATSPQQVYILAPQFFDLEGQSVYIGGAERYLLELIRLLREQKREPIVFQSAIGEWEREYEAAPIFGLNSGGDIGKLNVLFHNLIHENAPVIYMVFNLAAPYHSNRSVGISHGVFWDIDPQDRFADRSSAIDYLIRSFSNLSHIVSVDTNTINWLRTVQPSLAAKCSYIPNFVDVEKFKLVDRPTQDNLVVLYPRKLYPRRGFWLVHELVPEFLENYPQLEFRFVGQADPEEQKAVQTLIGSYPGRVSWQTLEMQDMHHAYEQADITLIPSLYSEGTSLACLEAMASGNAVIASNVGGLPDLVISGYNGLLIEPSVSALQEALIVLCEDPDLRNRFKNRGREIAENFNLDVWKARWYKLINEVLL